MWHVKTRVLLVEDDAGLRASIRRALELNCEVVEEPGREAAMARLEAEGGAFDLALIALALPGAGLPAEELLRRVRARWPQVGVIMFGAAGATGVTERCLELGALACVAVGSTDAASLPLRVANAAAAAALRRHGATAVSQCARQLSATVAGDRPARPASRAPAPALAAPPGAVQPFEPVMRQHYEQALRATGSMLKAAHLLKVKYGPYRRQLIAWGVVEVRRRRRA